MQRKRGGETQCDDADIMPVLERLFSNEILFKGYNELEEKITNFDSSLKLQGVEEPGTDASLIYQATRKE